TVALNNILAVQCAERNKVEFGAGKSGGGAFGEVLADVIEDALIELDQVHLVDGDYHAADAEQPGNQCMTPGLAKNSFPGIYKNEGCFSGGRPGGHVARVLLVAGGVGDDETALRRSEVTIGN